MDYGSASEGEIIGSGGKTKATKRQMQDKDREVDQVRRPRSHLSGSNRLPSSDYGLDYDEPGSGRSYQSRDHGDRHQGGLRGTKRRRQDDYHSRDDGRPLREHKIHYQDFNNQGGGPKSNGKSKEPPATHSEAADTNDPTQDEKPHDEEMLDAPPVDEAQLIEERRKRREALRAKHGREAPLLQKALHVVTSAPNTALKETDFDKTSVETSPTTGLSPATPQADATDSPAAISVADDTELANNALLPQKNGHDINEPSAADYDPTMDMQEDRFHREAVHFGGQKQTGPGSQADSKANSKAKQEEESQEFDMFADDIDFDSPDAANDIDQTDKAHGRNAVKGKQLDKSLLDDWDDPEGYYRIILGELLDKRYLVQSNLGKGVFSEVVRALDNKTDSTVAIKVIRKQETMYKAGMKEIKTLSKLAEADPDDKKHIIRLERHFMHKGHLCMVFENLSINLREVLKKFGRDIGINIKAVRAYAHQIFLGLGHMKKCDILHADLKPDNVLVNENRSQLKIADLGSALDVRDSEVTDVLVSRFYRAPEIMLGIKGDFALDMWSIGCTLFELYTGRICFTGSSNNQMLKAIMECRGRIPNRMLKRSEFAAQHFDSDGTFLSQEYDEITRKEVVRRHTIVRAVQAKELRARLFAGSKNLGVAEAKELNLFVDLLDKCLTLDPQRRITPNDALRHGFINRAAAVVVPPRAPPKAPLKAPLKAK